MSIVLATGRFAGDGARLVGQEVQTLGRLPGISAERDWPWWRGPRRDGIAAEQTVPAKFGPNDKVIWKTPVPGRGHSSPVVVADRVFLTTADEAEQIQSVLAFDRKTGRKLWQVEVSRGGFPERNHPKNSEATSTVACDGQHLFVTFFHHHAIELAAIDLAGNIVWQKKAGPFHPQKYEYGYAPSPLIFADLVIVAGEYDGDSFVAAFRRTDGREAWRIRRPSNVSFSSPVVTHVAGRDQLLISGADQVAAYDPRTGKSLWSAAGTTAATCGTIVWDSDLVFASGGYPKSETLAVRADGSGEVVWRNRQKCYEQSMIVVDGHLYALTDNGILFCWRGGDGREMWKRRLVGPVSASPVCAGGLIYWANELGTLYVFRPNPERFELVAENQIGDAAFPSPAICGGQIFLRVADDSSGSRQETLYCFGEATSGVLR
jgi:outer membrane protein assembly factor BamB